MSVLERREAAVTRRMLCILTALMVLAGASGCTEDSDTAPARPKQVKAVSCPAEVELSIMSDHDCGILDVPADRDDPGGARLQLMFLRVQPIAPHRDLEPIATVGYEVAHSPDIGDMAGIAGSSGREMIFLAQRGTQYSEPSVDCATTDLGDGDLAELARACQGRLGDVGVGVADFAPAESARDLEDLRAALKVPRWDLVSWGSASLVLLEYLRLHPDRVAAAVLDSPQFPELDPVSTASAELESALRTLQETCRGDARCGSILRRARSADALTLRQVRDALGREGRAATSQVLELLAGPTDGDGADGAQGTDDEPWCLGYVARCDDQLSLGAYLSATCPRVPDPMVDDARLPGFGIEDPLLPACDAWGMAPHPLAPVRTDVPVLLLRGDLDPFTPAALAAGTGAAWPSSYLVVANGLGHDVFSVSECLRKSRNEWLLAPDSPPDLGGCHAQLM